MVATFKTWGAVPVATLNGNHIEAVNLCSTNF